MSKLAKVENDIITNIILGVPSHYPDFLDITSQSYGIGWIKSGETFVAPEPEPVVISKDTLEWLRDDLEESYESTIRGYGLNPANNLAIEVQVFMDMIRDRIGDVLILSDPAYKMGILLIEQAGIFDTAKTDEMLALGGHSR